MLERRIERDELALQRREQLPGDFPACRPPGRRPAAVSEGETALLSTRVPMMLKSISNPFSFSMMRLGRGDLEILRVTRADIFHDQPHRIKLGRLTAAVNGSSP